LARFLGSKSSETLHFCFCGDSTIILWPKGTAKSRSATIDQSPNDGVVGNTEERITPRAFDGILMMPSRGTVQVMEIGLAAWFRFQSKAAEVSRTSARGRDRGTVEAE
jgi:hypothetical protein